MLFSGAQALEASIAAVSKYGGATAGYRTMLDALIPASTVLQEVINSRWVILVLCDICLCSYKLKILLLISEIKCWGWSCYCVCSFIRSCTGRGWVDQTYAGTGEILLIFLTFSILDNKKNHASALEQQQPLYILWFWWEDIIKLGLVVCINLTLMRNKKKKQFF